MTGSFQPSLFGQGPPIKEEPGAFSVPMFFGTPRNNQQISSVASTPANDHQPPSIFKNLKFESGPFTPVSATKLDSQPLFGLSSVSSHGRPVFGRPSVPNEKTFDFEQERKRMADEEGKRLLGVHLDLLKTGTELQGQHEISTTPMFTSPVLRHFRDQFSQYGFLAGDCDILQSAQTTALPSKTDPRLFFNIAAPTSAFICGSQGSGKSHTLSCMLENCLMKSDVSNLQKPLSGLIFHYDSFTSDIQGTPCEAAHLGSNRNIKVRVLCSPTNLWTMKRTYGALKVEVEPLRINQSDLTTKRMLDLMAVSSENGPMPLYLHAINRILRELRIEQQETSGSFNYVKFKKRVMASDMSPAQLGPLNQRLDTLESFMPAWQTEMDEKKVVNMPKKITKLVGNDWSVKPGYLTIVDLSCPCVTAEGACALFNMCLSLFLEQQTTTGRVVALDEAHKYMNGTTEANNLTNTLLSSIRLQRHLGTRVFISTQEPTISPKLLDLCSITIVHRFSSPDWLRCLRSHLAALDHEDEDNGQRVNVRAVFNKIVRLQVGEALLFAPSAIVGIEKGGEDGDFIDEIRVKKLGVEYLRVKIRARITADGGKSVFAK